MNEENRIEMDFMEDLTPIEPRVNYAVNISYDDEPFWIQPIRAIPYNISTLQSYCPECGIYFLFDKGAIVYIGVSGSNVYSRICAHFKDKKFDAYYVMTASDRNGAIDEGLMKTLIRIEAFLILTFRPKYNSLTPLALREVRRPKKGIFDFTKHIEENSKHKYENPEVLQS